MKTIDDAMTAMVVARNVEERTAALVDMQEAIREELDRLMAAALSKAQARVVIATDVQASEEPGAWKCGGCGFQGFWHGGVHCMRAVAQ